MTKEKGEKKGIRTPSYGNGPKGAAHKRLLTPFSSTLSLGGVAGS